MIESVVIAAFLFVIAGFVYARPEQISTLRGYSSEKLRNIDLKKVRRTAGGGMALLAVMILAGCWLLLLSGVGESTVTVLRIVAVFAGVAVIMARVETFN